VESLENVTDRRIDARRALLEFIRWKFGKHDLGLGWFVLTRARGSAFTAWIAAQESALTCTAIDVPSVQSLAKKADWPWRQGEALLATLKP
jgi:hypothetical protein